MFLDSAELDWVRFLQAMVSETMAAERQVVAMGLAALLVLNHLPAKDQTEMSVWVFCWSACPSDNLIYLSVCLSVRLII